MRVRMKKCNYKEFIEKDTITLAKQLLGKLIIMESSEGKTGGYIVETEAYIGREDEACHGYQGKITPKVESLYKEAGTIYVYTMHTHNMLNIVACECNNPQAVLIRGIEPAIGLHLMEERRGQMGILVSNGPGKLTKAMGITRELNGTLLQECSLFIDFEHSKLPEEIQASARIGIPNKGVWTDEKLRFYVKGNPYVSGIRKRDMIENCWKDHYK
jgi:DNA-3-methyladenine glycosylase